MGLDLVGSRCLSSKKVLRQVCLRHRNFIRSGQGLQSGPFFSRDLREPLAIPVTLPSVPIMDHQFPLQALGSPYGGPA